MKDIIYIVLAILVITIGCILFNNFGFKTEKPVVQERFVLYLIKSDPQTWMVTDKMTERSYLAIRDFGIIDLRDRESYKVKP